MKSRDHSLTQLAIAVVAVASQLSAYSAAGGQTPRDAKYPAHWWTPVSKDGAPGWEILPQEAGPGEVILSKRNELGLLSKSARHSSQSVTERHYVHAGDDRVRAAEDKIQRRLAALVNPKAKVRRIAK